MTLAFIIATVVAIVFFLLWSEEKDKLERAESKIKQLTRENKNLKLKRETSIVENSKKTKGFVIPKPVKKKEEPLLDKGKLAALQKQTKAAQDMLAEIFIQEDESMQETVQHSNLNPLIEILGKLLTKEQWTRIELADLVGPDVMIGNLLEQINDYAYSIVNDVVVEEDGEYIYVTTQYKERLI